MLAKYFRDALRHDALNICLQAADDIPNVKNAMLVVDRFANALRTNYVNAANVRLAEIIRLLSSPISVATFRFSLLLARYQQYLSSSYVVLLEHR